MNVLVKALFLIIVLYTTSLNVIANTGDYQVKTAPTPSWVVPRTVVLDVTVPVDEISNGVFYRLIDSQIRVEHDGAVAYHSRYVESVVNKLGIENSSQINITFDPTYQNVVLNSLIVIRDGQRLDRLTSAKISVFKSEQELEQQIYNDSLTLNVLLDDIRAGDTLDYSYTRFGANTVYNNIFSYGRSISWSVPVFDQYVSVLWGKNIPLFISTRNSEPKIEKNSVGKFTQYSLHLHNQKTRAWESQSPSWYDPYTTIYFSEIQHWSEVVQWALPLYQIAATDDSVRAIAQQIKQENTSQAQQVSAALKYSQTQIRYVGLEMGSNSHRPTSAKETLALRYGDCKDKAVLFIAILAALDIDAYPALVDTEDDKLLNEKPPALNRFNHVIVWLALEGKTYWFDPTLSNQFGDLEHLFQPDYGYALIVKQGENALTAMVSEHNNSFTHINETYVIPEKVTDVLSFTIKTDYLGEDAAAKNRHFERDGKKKVSQDYVNYYQRTHAQLSLHLPLTINIDEQSGVLSVDEHYKVSDFWQKKKTKLELDFYPSEIRDAVYKPKQIERSAPLSLTFPNSIKHHSTVEFKEQGWSFNNEEFVEDNAYFYFKKQVNFKNNILALDYVYYSKQDHIAASQINDYLAARKRLRKEAYFGIYKYAEKAEIATDDELSNWQPTVIIILACYVLAWVFVIVGWRIESNKRPTFANGQFYALAPFNFVALSVLTLGIFSSYWMYRNWLFLKQRDDLTIMPIMRGIFSIFWFYPLFSALRADSEQRFGHNKVQATWLAVLSAFAFVAVAVIGSMGEYMMPLFDSISNHQYFAGAMSLISLLSFLLMLPMLSYINHLNETDKAAYQYNSTLRIRHGILLLISMPIIVIAVAQQINLIPNGTVISGKDLMSWDVKFLQRKNIVSTDERIQYFYTSDALTMRDEGNGFTRRRVFSYWLDNEGEFEQRSVNYLKVADIVVEFASGDDIDTVITVKHTDGSTFMLYVAKEQGKDKVFAKNLLRLWQENKTNIGQ